MLIFVSQLVIKGIFILCGFAGFLSNSTSDHCSRDVLNRMASSLRHRGPDDFGIWCDPYFHMNLVHTRLSIVDVSQAGHQPMESACERFVIAFNGEVYNHLELRALLETEFHVNQWLGHSDTETLLACFSAWGVKKTIEKTVGMFALALWDIEEQTLTLVRDRLGEKPIYWGWCGDSLLFGSELKAIVAHADFNSGVDRAALKLLMRHNYIPSPYSIYEAIEKLPAGTWVQIKKGQSRKDVEPIAYWSLKDTVEYGIANQIEGSEVETVNLLEKTINQSLAGQMLSDVPLGAFLSGGVDSSAVVALMQQQSDQPVRTFAIGFDEPDFNEAEYAGEVAKYLGTNHTELYVSAQDALDLVPRLPDIYCEPFADSSQLPTFLVSSMAREHVTVALSGDGGDELFGGYNPYQFAPVLWARLTCLPLPFRQIAAQIFSGAPLTDKLFKLLRVLPAKSKEEFFQILTSHWRDSEELVIDSPEYQTLIGTPEMWPQVDSFEHWMMAMDTGQYMLDDILVKVDRAAMANSLETRIPLLDHRIVELAWRIPLHMKIRGGVGKWVLREVLHRYVPRELIDRPKKGFSVPLGQWLRGPLKEWAEELLNEQRLRTEGFLNPSVVRRVWSEHLQGRYDHARKLWTILMFQAWLERS